MDIFERIFKDKPATTLSRTDLFDIAAGRATEATTAQLPDAVRASAQTAKEWGQIVANEHVSLGDVTAHLWRRSHPDSAFSLERMRFHAAACARCEGRVAVADSIDRIRHVADRSTHTEPFLQAFATWGEPAFRSAQRVDVEANVLDANGQPRFDGANIETRRVQLQRALFDHKASALEVELVGIPPEIARVWIALTADRRGFMMPEVAATDGTAVSTLTVIQGVGPDQNWNIDASSVTAWLIMRA